MAAPKAAAAPKKAAAGAATKVAGKAAGATPPGRAAKAAMKTAPKVAPKTAATVAAKAPPAAGGGAPPGGSTGTRAPARRGAGSGPAPRRSPPPRARPPRARPQQARTQRTRARRAIGRSLTIRRALLAEFLICLVLLGVGAMVLDDPSQTGSHLAIRGSALAGVFLILGLVAAGGDGARRFATAVGLLVTLSYVFAERTTITKLATWASNASGSVAKTGQVAGSVGEGAAAGMGAVAAQVNG